MEESEVQLKNNSSQLEQRVTILRFSLTVVLIFLMWNLDDNGQCRRKHYVRLCLLIRCGVFLKLLVRPPYFYISWMFLSVWHIPPPPPYLCFILKVSYLIDVKA